MMYNVRDFGACGNGTRLDHAAFQEAIDQCHASGGGCVTVPGGDYLCRMIELKSKVDLHLENGARILAADAPEQSGASQPAGRALIFAEGASDIALTGSGQIDGRAHGKLARPAPPRLKLVNLSCCRNVRVQDVALLNSDSWTMHLFRCDHVAIRGVTIINDLARVNADGIDPDCCTNVIISDCYIVSSDDSIVLKSTAEYPCENILVSNCIVESHAHGLKIGTESVGPIRRAAFNNCIVRNCDIGIGIDLRDGGDCEDILFNNISISTHGHGLRTGPRECPIGVFLDKRRENARVGRLRDVAFNNIHIRSRGKCLFQGMPAQPIENLIMSGVSYRAAGALCFWPRRKPGGGRQEPYALEEDFSKFPAFLTFANVRNLFLRGLVFDSECPDVLKTAHVAAFFNVQDGAVDGVFNRLRSAPGNFPETHLENSRGVGIQNIPSPRG